ncbi:MAG TPA: NAD(P)-dependent oxidoreductase [Burkholderiales bacterium]|nr:NAD(P)-dependent oxidoreductase [Burkholderiales bacterium]
MITHLSAAPQTPERVVLLGAHGFIGAALRRLLDNRQIPNLALTSADLDISEVSAAEKLAALLRPGDAAVMLAALTPDKGRDIAALMKNLTMMQNVCAAIGKVGSAHFVYFSSDAVYSASDALVTEETPPSPPDLYGAMHHTREIMARGLSKVPVLVLRPTLIYGLDDTHNSYGPNRFRRAAQKDGRITLFGGGEETRDHIHVDDVAALTLRCLLHRSTGTLNAVTGTSHSFHRVAEIVARQFKTTVEIVKTPRANPVTHRHYAITAAIKAFPDIRFTGLEEGVARVHREMLGKR